MSDWDTSISRRSLIKAATLASTGIVSPAVVRTSPANQPSAAPELQQGLRNLVAKHRMPGAVAGVHQGGQLVTAAAGTANLNTAAPMAAGIGFLTGVHHQGVDGDAGDDAGG